jgi:hypothetical protein
MAKFLIEIYLDGYTSTAGHDKACAEFVYDQLNMTASCVTIEAVIESAPAPTATAEGASE